MSFLVLLLTGLILLWSPWRTGYPREVLRPWVERVASFGQGWVGVAAVLSLLLPVALLLWAVQGLVYGFITLLLHVTVLLMCVGRHDPLRSMTTAFKEAWERGDRAAAAQVSAPHLEGSEIHSAELSGLLRARMVAASLQDYFAPAFWYLLLGPLGALGYRLLELTRLHRGQAMTGPATLLMHALEWLPARLLVLSFALVGQFDSTLQVLHKRVTEWEAPAGELVAACATAALPPVAADDVRGVEDTRHLLVRALLSWAVIVAFFSMLG